MANFCYNTVHFIGSDAQKEKLKILFDTMAIKEAEMKEGHVPAFVELSEGFLFKTTWEDGVLFYQTKMVSQHRSNETDSRPF